MAHIHQVHTDEDRAQARELFWEYLQWANGRVHEEFGVDFDIRSMLEEDMAKLIGYQTLRLDSARFMKTAHALYRSAGFREIESYPESEIPPEFRRHWV